MNEGKKPVGPPIKYTQERLKEISDMMEAYTNATDIPIVAEFAYQNNFYREELYKHKELNYALRRMIDKKEAQLEKLALFNEVNSSIAALSLKQLGWRDKPKEEEQTMPNDPLVEAMKQALGKADA